MSDTSTQTGAEGSSATEVAGPPGGAPSQEAIQAAASKNAAEGGEGTQQQQEETFSREYVEQLRREAAGYRTKAKEFEEAFSGYDPDSRAALLDIARQLADPTTQPAAARRLQAIAEKIMEGEKAGTPRRPDGEEDPDQRPMTRAEWKAEQARLQEEQEHAAAIRDIEETSRGLGIEPGSLEYAELLFIAQDPDVAGDLSKAKEKLDAHYAAKSRQRAEELAKKGERWPGVPSVPGTPAGDVTSEKPKTLADATRAARAALRGVAGSA